MRRAELTGLMPFEGIEDRSRAVVVTNLATGEVVLYSCAPEMAVVCAYEQYTCKNWNTWLYDVNNASVTASGTYCICGDWSAKREG